MITLRTNHPPPPPGGTSKKGKDQWTIAFLRLVLVLLVGIGFSRSATYVGLSLDSVSSFIDQNDLSFLPKESIIEEQQQQGTTNKKKKKKSLLQFTPPCEDESSACKIPKWMKEYFRWQRETLAKINSTQPSDWMEQKMLVLECMDDDNCGGTADRLRPLPFYIALAARSKRLFFIRWSRPVPLEALVDPYQLNWSIPKALARLIDKNEGGGKIEKIRDLGQMIDVSSQDDVWTMQVLSTSMTYFEAYKNVILSSSMENDTATEPILKPWDYFHDLFLALFRPVQGLQDVIDDTMDRLNLIPNQYMVAHVRSLYPKHPYAESGKIDDLEPSVWNAIDCASYVLPDAPVFVAADTIAAKQIAQDYGRSNRTTARVVSDLDLIVQDKNDNPTDATTTETTTEAKNGTLPGNPLHLDETNEKDPSAYYSIFLDLFLMSQSRCVPFGAGGYGRFGAEASFNNSCWIQHTNQFTGRVLRCHPPSS